MCKKVLCLATLVLILGLISSASANLVVNGNWCTGDETGWTRWQAPRGNPMWAVTDCECGTDPTCPCEAPMGKAFNSAGASFGWFQRIAVTPGQTYNVEACWCGDIGGAGWAEVMFFTCTQGQSDDDVVARIDAGNAGDIAYKKDSWGLNPPTAWSCEAASLSLMPGGNGGTIVATCAEIVVALKLGSGGGHGWTCWDNVTVVPEPATIALLGLGGLALLRRRK